MAVSRDLKIAIKLGDRPAWKIAQEASLHESTLSKIISGCIDVQPGDYRVEAIAKVLNLDPSDCYEAQQGIKEHEGECLC